MTDKKDKRGRREFLSTAGKALAGLGVAGCAGSLLGDDKATESFPTPDYDWTQHRWAYGIDATKCIGCLRCVEACKTENGKVLGCPLGNLALEMSTQDPVLQERLRAVFESHIQAFRSLLDEAVESGELAPTDTLGAARSLLALVEGNTMLAKMSDDPEILRGQAERAMRLIGATPAA